MMLESEQTFLFLFLPVTEIALTIIGKYHNKISILFYQGLQSPSHLKDAGDTMLQRPLQRSSKTPPHAGGVAEQCEEMLGGI